MQDREPAAELQGAGTRVVVVGASGSIGHAVSEELANDCDVVALTRFALPKASGRNIEWRPCDLFDPDEIEPHLADRDVAIYLVHTRLPSARLDQAKCEDMDLIIADNVARAAAHHGVRQIICLRGLIPEEESTAEEAARREEIVTALGAYGTPVTVLRASLVVAPGGSTLNLIARLVDGGHLVPVPRWTDHPKQPIALRDLLRAFRLCVTDAQLAGREYEIGGPVITSWRGILERGAELLGTRPRLVALRWCPRWAYALWVRWRSPAAHPALARLLVEDLRYTGVARSNPLQDRIEPDSLSPGEAIAPFLGSSARDRLANPRSGQLPVYEAQLKAARQVRSIQRMDLPAGRDAAWLAAHYFEWLGRVMRPVIACELKPDESYEVRIRWPRMTLLRLSLKTDHQVAGRQTYYITGGLLASSERNQHGRMDFHNVLNGRHGIVAIHEFAPSLPWNFYHWTQAMAHGFVMWLFQRHMKKLAKQGG